LKVSVLICVHNEEKYILKCIKSLLDQTVKDFEIVIVDDCSTDNTPKIINEFDKRLRYFRNERNFGIVKSRNRSLKLARGDYVFFMDGDCIVSKDWIEQGLKTFKKSDCVGVEGITYYVSKDYKPTISDRVSENREGCHFGLANMAYKKNVLIRIGGLNERYFYREDRELAFRVMKQGRIYRNVNMVVYHQKVTRSVKDVMKKSKRIVSKIYIFKDHGDRTDMLWRIIYPRNLITLLFPLSVFLAYISYKYKKRGGNYNLLPFIYISIVIERIYLWKECIRERVFLI